MDQTGVVWFAQAGSNQIGSLNPSTQSIREYVVPTSNSMPVAVAAGQSGRIWFAELEGEKLGLLSASTGNITEFPLPPASAKVAGVAQHVDCGPASVTVGPDGNVWVACLFSNEISEFLIASRSFNEFPLPVFLSGPVGMVFDKNGSMWFSAADVDMVGRAVISELRNGTSAGITEKAPINSTYTYHLPHQTGFLGQNDTITSSLPTPSGIALDPDGHTLWITEHVDSSFDSYNTFTGSLVRYWTSQTNNQYGFPVSFPNGIAIDAHGHVWIAEHYGNRVAEFDPATGSMREFDVKCCGSHIAGVYTLALGKDGSVWFVEIQGNAIGELKPSTTGETVTLGMGGARVDLGPSGAVSLPLWLSVSGSAGGADAVLSASGISATGALENASASFLPQTLHLNGGDNRSSNLDLQTSNLKPGAYYLTVGAHLSPSNVTYSAVVKLVVSQSSQSEFLLEIALTASAVLIAGLALLRWRRLRNGARSRNRLRPNTRYARNASATTATATSRMVRVGKGAAWTDTESGVQSRVSGVSTQNMTV